MDGDIRRSKDNNRKSKLKMPKLAIRKLNPRHYEILKLCLRGLTTGQIAARLNMSAQQVSIVLHSPSFQYELTMRRDKLDDLTDQAIVSNDDEVTKAIKEHTLAAIQRLGFVASAKNEDGKYKSSDADAVRASADILDRGGYPKTQRSEVKTLSVVISDASAKLIADTIEIEKTQPA